MTPPHAWGSAAVSCNGVMERTHSRRRTAPAKTTKGSRRSKALRRTGTAVLRSVFREQREPHKTGKASARKKRKKRESSSFLPHAQMLATAACRGSAPALPAARPGGGCLLGRVRISRRRAPTSRRSAVVRCGLLPVDPWAPTMDSQSIASQLFAVSLFPYLGFLYFMTRSKTAPGLTLFGFYFLLAFVGATTKVHYGTSLSNVDLLHGTAESLLTLTNLFIVLGLRGALRKLKDGEESNSEASQDNKEKSSV
ncbi:hypothetical protein ACQ4PT_045725 [Festuca glaucescens]